MNHDHPIKAMCEVLEISRSGYYQWRSTQTSARALQTEAIKGKIARVHEAYRCTYGSPRETAALHEQGEQVGRNRMARLMKEAGLQGRQARRYRVRATDTTHPDPVAPNLLAEAPAPTKPDEVWATDITHAETGEGWLYLAGVLDLYSRRLIGRAMGSSLATALPLAALHMALRRRRPGAGLASSLGSWLPICQCGLSRRVGQPRLHGLHEPPGQLLR